MKVKGKSYKSVWLDKKKHVVVVIDQRKLPHNFKLLYLKNIKEIKIAIKNMIVRGAPLIGVTAAYGIYLSMRSNPSDRNLNLSVNFLKNARPTAVNLSWALEFMEKRLLDERPSHRANISKKIAEEISINDIKCCKKIATNGLKIIACPNLILGGFLLSMKFKTSGPLTNPFASSFFIKSRDCFRSI